MGKLRELLRLKYGLKSSHRQIAASLSIGTATISKLSRAAQANGLTWPLPEGLDDDELERRVCGAPVAANVARKVEPAYLIMVSELARKGVTLQLLWEEYGQALSAEETYSYSQFCQRFRDWQKRQPLSMRQAHTPGEKLFVDYAGPTIAIIDPATGEVHTAQIFVAVLGYSNYTFAEATWSQKLPDWIGSHKRVLHFIGGVPTLIVPDNLKSGVRDACRFDPDLNPTYAFFAAHYAVAVMPARPYKPKDKAKAEVGVQIVERWILARLRHHTFFSLSEANVAIQTLLEVLNNKRMRVYQQSRRERFEQHERALLRSLPAHDYVYTEIKTARVHIDYHVEIDHHYYSVPYALIRQELQAHCSAERVVLKHRGRLVASHARSHVPGAHTTQTEHMPTAHRAHAEWSPERLQQWSERIGVSCAQYVSGILTSKTHPQQAYRACLGLLSLGKRYGEARLENACTRALQLRSTRVKTIRNILTHGLDQQPINASTQTSLPLHDNVRGANNYH